MSKPADNDPRKSEYEMLLGFVLGIALAVFKMSVPLRTSLLLVFAVICTHLILRSHWTRYWRVWTKIIALVAVVYFVWVGVQQCKQQWLDEHPLLTIAIPNPLAPTPPASANSNVDSSREKFASPPLVIDKVNVKTGNAVGERVSIELDIKVNRNSPLVIRQYTAEALKVISEDANKQTAFEQAMWDQILKATNGTPLAIPSSNKSVAITLRGDALTDDSLQYVESGGYGWYFLLRMTDLHDHALLNFCGYVLKDGTVTYCRYHNSP